MRLQDFIYDPNLVLYLPLWKKDSTTIMSDDAYGHTATVTGALWTLQGRSFDGTDDVINCGSADSLDALTGPQTHTIWVNPTDLGETNGTIIEKGSIASRGFKLIMVATETARFYIYVGGASRVVTAANNEVPFNSWTCVSCIFDGTKVLIDTNGTILDGAASTGPIDAHASDDFLIGDNSASTRCFKGLIGEIWSFSRYLSPLERHALRLATKWRYQ